MSVPVAHLGLEIVALGGLLTHAQFRNYVRCGRRADDWAVQHLLHWAYEWAFLLGAALIAGWHSAQLTATYADTVDAWGLAPVGIALATGGLRAAGWHLTHGLRHRLRDARRRRDDNAAREARWATGRWGGDGPKAWHWRAIATLARVTLADPRTALADERERAELAGLQRLGARAAQALESGTDAEGPHRAELYARWGRLRHSPCPSVRAAADLVRAGATEWEATGDEWFALDHETFNRWTCAASCVDAPVATLRERIAEIEALREGMVSRGWRRMDDPGLARALTTLARALTQPRSSRYLASALRDLRQRWAALKPHAPGVLHDEVRWLLDVLTARATLAAAGAQSERRGGRR